MSDLISRQAAIDIFEPWLKVEEYSWGELNMLKCILDELKSMPSAQPERKKGRWININDSEKYQCSECGITMWFPKSLDITPDTYIFCPHCGTEMTEGKRNEKETYSVSTCGGITCFDINGM